MKRNSETVQNNIDDKLTSKQKQILLLIYKFRFIHRQQIQEILNHKSPQRTQEWLKDLKEKGYIRRQHYVDPLENHTKPAIYFLSLKARKMLKENKKRDKKALAKLYKEHTRSLSFITYCLTLVDIYLYFLSKVTAEEIVKFFTESQLLRYDYFPQSLPSAYISVKTGLKTKRYFLELFKDYEKAKALRYRIKKYMDYVDSGNWEEHANGQSFPMVLFVCPHEKMKKHILYFAKAKFEESFYDNLSLYLTTIEDITKQRQNIWEKVE